jgi:hypothetical protein
LENKDNQSSDQIASPEQPIQAEPAPQLASVEPTPEATQPQSIAQPEPPKPDPQAEQAELAADAQDTEAQALEKQKRNLALMEAALFVAGRPLTLTNSAK